MPALTRQRPVPRGRARHRLAVGATLAALVGLTLGLIAVSPAETASATRRGPSPTAQRTGTWSTTVTAAPASDTTAFEDQTIRQIVHTSIGGTAPRVRLSNEFGTAPLVIGEAHIALRDTEAAGTAPTRAGTDRRLTFGGRASVTIPAGAPAYSDPVDLRVPADADLVISLYLPQRSPGGTLHAFAQQRNHVAAGNVTGARDIEATETLDRWYFLSGVSVRPAERHASAVVTLGDSITDGVSSEVGGNHRWPDVLADRLARSHHTDGVGVLNQGMTGNRLLHDPNPPEGHEAEGYAAYFGTSGLARFDRDVLAQPGADHVIVLLGVNDLGHPGTIAPEAERVTAEDLIAGHRQLIARAHEAGLRIYGGTITPFAHDTLGYHSPANEAIRQQVNAWVRTSGEYDGVIDFDAAVRDPEEPKRLLAAYDSGDHLHPNDAGLAAMARAVPLWLFR